MIEISILVVSLPVLAFILSVLSVSFSPWIIIKDVINHNEKSRRLFETTEAFNSTKGLTSYHRSYEGWLIACWTLAVLALTAQLVTVVLLLIYFCKVRRLGVILTATCAVFLSCVSWVVTVGVWISSCQRQVQDLSWGYGVWFAVTSAALSLISTFVCVWECVHCNKNTGKENSNYTSKYLEDYDFSSSRNDDNERKASGFLSNRHNLEQVVPSTAEPGKYDHMVSKTNFSLRRGSGSHDSSTDTLSA